jgi:hypothetical protein
MKLPTTPPSRMVGSYRLVWNGRKPLPRRSVQFCVEAKLFTPANSSASASCPDPRLTNVCFRQLLPAITPYVTPPVV